MKKTIIAISSVCVVLICIVIPTMIFKDTPVERQIEEQNRLLEMHDKIVLEDIPKLIKTESSFTKIHSRFMRGDEWYRMAFDFQNMSGAIVRGTCNIIDLADGDEYFYLMIDFAGKTFFVVKTKDLDVEGWDKPASEEPTKADIDLILAKYATLQRMRELGGKIE